MKAFEPLPFAVCWPQDGEESSGTSPRPAMCFTPASALSLQSTPDGVTRAPSGGVPTEAVSWLAIYMYIYTVMYNINDHDFSSYKKQKIISKNHCVCTVINV